MNIGHTARRDMTERVHTSASWHKGPMGHNDALLGTVMRSDPLAGMLHQTRLIECIYGTHVFHPTQSALLRGPNAISWVGEMDKPQRVRSKVYSRWNSHKFIVGAYRPTGLLRCRDSPDERASRWYDVGAQEPAGDWLVTYWRQDEE